jgi:hypothetical protein
LRSKLANVMSEQETELQSKEQEIFNSTLDSILSKQMATRETKDVAVIKKKIEQKYLDLLSFGDVDDKD